MRSLGNQISLFSDLPPKDQWPTDRDSLPAVPTPHLVYRLLLLNFTLDYSPTLKIDAVYFSETLGSLITRCYKPGHHTLRSNRCDSPKPITSFLFLSWQRMRKRTFLGPAVEPWIFHIPNAYEAKKRYGVYVWLRIAWVPVSIVVLFTQYTYI